MAQALASRIRVARVRGNLTQEELAAELDVSPRSVQEWEAGRSFPRPSSRRKLDELFARLDRETAAA